MPHLKPFLSLLPSNSHNLLLRSQLDLSHNSLCGVTDTYTFTRIREGTYTAVGINAIADALCVNASLTSCNVLYNEMDLVAAKLLADAVKEKDISLCGIKPDQTTADFNGLGKSNKLKPADADAI